MNAMPFLLLLFVMAGTTYAIRALPLLLIRKEITNPYIRAFLYYVPYVTLTVMTFPAVLEITGKGTAPLDLLPGAVGLITAAITALTTKSLMLSALFSSLSIWLLLLIA